MPLRIFRKWLRWRKDWDSICNCCGKCCYTRSIGPHKQVIIHYNRPCENLDTETHLCRIYKDRLKKCNHCGKVTLFTALFHPTLPEDCAYVQMFRRKDEKKEDDGYGKSKKADSIRTKEMSSRCVLEPGGNHYL